MRGKNFPHILLFDLKLDHNSTLHAKIRENSLVIDSRIEFPDPILMTLDRGKIIFSPLWFLILKLDHNSGLHAKIRVQNWVYCHKVSEFRHPRWTYHKVFEKCLKNAGKIRGEIIVPTFCCLIKKKLDHNSGQHAKNQREISLVIKSEGFLVFQGENAEKGGNGIRREGNGL